MPNESFGPMDMQPSFYSDEIIQSGLGLSFVPSLEGKDINKLPAPVNNLLNLLNTLGLTAYGEIVNLSTLQSRMTAPEKEAEQPKPEEQ